MEPASVRGEGDFPRYPRVKQPQRKPEQLQQQRQERQRLVALGLDLDLRAVDKAVLAAPVARARALRGPKGRDAVRGRRGRADDRRPPAYPPPTTPDLTPGPPGSDPSTTQTTIHHRLPSTQ